LALHTFLGWILGLKTPFFLSPKHSLLRVYDELAPEDQKLALDFVKLLKKKQE
jgi:hypothetical protein